MAKINIYHPRALNRNIVMKHSEEYWDDFWTAKSEGKNDREAYEFAEIKWEAKFGVHRFIDYPCFRVGKYDHLHGRGKSKAKNNDVDPNQLLLF